MAVRAAAVRCGLPQSVADGDWCATLEQLVGELQARRMLRYAAALRTAGGGSGESDDAAPSEVNAVAAEVHSLRQPPQTSHTLRYVCMRSISSVPDGKLVFPS